METKNTSSSGSVLEEPEIQKLQMQAKKLKENSLNKLNALKTTIQHLSSSNHSMYYEFREAFHRLFDANEGLFRSVLSRNMQNLEMQFSNETLHEKDSNSELRAIKGQFEHFIHSKMFELSKYNTNAREILQDFNAYTTMEAQTFKETIIQNMDSIAKCMVERASHEQELKMTLKKLSERQLQIQQCKVQEVQSSVTSSGDETSSGIVSEEEIDKKELEAHYGFMAKIQEVLPAESSSTDTPLEQVQNNDENNVFANERQHSEKNSAECTDERAALANLIANLTLDTEENKTILKQLKKANASLTQELKECRTNLDETGRALGEATSCRDSCLIALQNKQNEFEKNKTEDTTPSSSQVVQQTGIQCFNCKGYGHYAKECRKPKRVKDYAYHKEKMMMCKQAEQGVPLQAEQADWLEDTDEEIDEQELEAHYSYMAKIQEVSPEESSSTGQPLEQKDDSNVTPDSSNICTNDNQVDQNAAECVDERAALANLIANLTLDTEKLEKCKTNLDETNSALGEAISCRDSCLIALQNKQNEFEKYKAFNDRTIDYEILQTKLNETLGLLALKDIEIKEGLKTKAYEISVLNQKHDELVKKSLLTRSQLEGYLKENTKVISDLKVKEDKDIDKMIEMDKQLKFLNEIVYTRNQSIQTIHMLAPKCSTYNGRPTFANPRYLKKAQSEKPCLYEIPYDTSDPANRFAPDREETMTLDNESRSKLNKDYVKPYDYTKQNSL
ncbi:integrase, catalytic region, zinc finger, CCHC-type containing protein [Tanacetum coccineum]|uniref:Integrase, catalytic region, zinc finger, CCHC-type containing protein n=1 Tax=Tanacetum coccineum TaxID=301880 RepID=A0ABQ5FT14_9ASTR